MGRVYRAEQTNLGRTVAVKVIHPHLVGEESTAARFITEARASSRLNHPNSVGVIDFGKTDDGLLYLVMEFLRGKDLARINYEEGPLSFRRIIHILRQVLAALSEAHHLEIIHRDLKPENIILERVRTGGDFVKVVDFGLAKMREDTRPGITSPGIVCGTPEYMSPEQGRGDPLDARSDIYAVGVILYQLLTGRLPFEADSPTQVVLMHITHEPLDPRHAAPTRMIPPQLAHYCLMALAKDPALRFSSADDFATALSEVLVELEPSVASRLPPSAAIRCTVCNTLNSATQKFCGECATALHPAPALIENTTPRVGHPVLLPTTPPAGNETPPAHVVGVGRSNELLQFPLPFVGRDDDLTWLHDRLSAASKELCGARIVGDVGMGKTRLLNEFLTRCRNARHLVVHVGPDPHWAEVAFYSVRQAIVGLAALPPDGGGPKHWVLADPVAEQGLAEIFGSHTTSQLSAEELRTVLAEALRWAIVSASERAQGVPVIIAVDDLQAVDGCSRAAFADVVGAPPKVPALVVVTYPPGHDPGWPANIASARVLTGLPASVVSQGFVGVKAIGERLSASVAGRGIAPLYIEQRLRFAAEQGGQAPVRLVDLIALRVEHLPPDARRVLQALAVYGDSATIKILECLVPRSTPVRQALETLVRVGMVEPDSPPSRYRTTHPLLRDVVLTTIPVEVRRDLHAICIKLAESHPVPLEALALHQYHAQSTFQALITLERVAALATTRGDLNYAIATLRRGLELARYEIFRGELEDPLHAVLLFARKLGHALTEAGQFTDAEGVLREALDVAGPKGEARARVLHSLATIAVIRDRHDEARAHVTEAIGSAFAAANFDLVRELEELKNSISG